MRVRSTADGLAEDDGDAGAVEVLEAGGGDVDAVGAGVEMGEEVVAGGGGDGLLVDVGGGFVSVDAGVGDGGAGGIEYAAAEGSSDLGVRRAETSEGQEDEGENS